MAVANKSSGNRGARRSNASYRIASHVGKNVRNDLLPPGWDVNTKVSRLIRSRNGIGHKAEVNSASLAGKVGQNHLTDEGGGLNYDRQSQSSHG